MQMCHELHASRIGPECDDAVRVATQAVRTCSNIRVHSCAWLATMDNIRPRCRMVATSSQGHRMRTRGRRGIREAPRRTKRKEQEDFSVELYVPREHET